MSVEKKKTKRKRKDHKAGACHTHPGWHEDKQYQLELACNYKVISRNNKSFLRCLPVNESRAHVSYMLLITIFKTGGSIESVQYAITYGFIIKSFTIKKIILGKT